MTKRVSVLIVEDDDWLASLHGRTLTNAGYTVHYAAHALAAMDQIDITMPDVILLDLLLAGPNALTLLHELRSHNDLAGIPVVLCTNSADFLSEADLATYGVRQVLDKSTMHPDDVVAAVRRATI